MEWKVVTRPMLIESQRPDYCPCTSEEEFPTCPLCPATVEGNDVVRGVCQARYLNPPPKPLVELITVRK